MVILYLIALKNASICKQFQKSGRNSDRSILLNVFRKALPFSQMYEIVVDTATL